MSLYSKLVEECQKREKLIKKSLQAGWTELSYESCILWRQVPYSVCLSGDITIETISCYNLEFCGPTSRVWKNLKTNERIIK